MLGQVRRGESPPPAILPFPFSSPPLLSAEDYRDSLTISWIHAKAPLVTFPMSSLFDIVSMKKLLSNLLVKTINYK